MMKLSVKLKSNNFPFLFLRPRVLFLFWSNNFEFSKNRWNNKLTKNFVFYFFFMYSSSSFLICHVEVMFYVFVEIICMLIQYLIPLYCKSLSSLFSLYSIFNDLDMFHWFHRFPSFFLVSYLI